MKYLRENAYRIIFFLCCLIVSLAIIGLYNKGIITSGLEIIPHIITVASIVLGIISLNLTILISIRDGKLYKWVNKNKSNILTQIYGYAFSSLKSSLLSIIISLTILLTQTSVKTYDTYKYGCIFLLSLSFLYMISTVAMSFYQCIQMLRLDDENSN